ncbi:AAA domain-containing protein [Aromatoleum toluvorans]|uniref:AAA domain-containing protein n=1 Tax=Aromatoleum toluvorans TaxID=92002 RepID=A0ABX1Q4B7_9RHOO|nr:AAA family ATPase [Aromatoleum toluvorans]NMG45201.1 AAA domain-containing protein [Aromatoleum toluvorans]
MPHRYAIRVLEAANCIILGKERELRLALTCLIARGHLLIEDVPGVGKTTLAHVIARLVGLHFQRIQFTSDLLPADIIGVSIFDREAGSFRFHPGPIFSQLILADEINRATPKTQSALLEAMEERQVTADSETHALPEPFFVIATQNPSHQIGTFPLPESQLDRFLLRIRLGYPDRNAERALLMGEDRRELLERQQPVIQPEDLLALQQAAHSITVSARLVDYVQALLASTRHNPELSAGLSPRAGLGLIAAARAWALTDGRDHVLPEDVQTVFPHVAAHRLHFAGDGRSVTPEALGQLIRDVTVV